MNILKNRNFENTLNIEIQNGEVLIKTPNYLTKEDIQNIICDVKKAIAKRQEKYIQRENVKIFGEYCQVKINYKNLKKPTLKVEDKKIKICLPNKYKKLNKDEIVEKLIEKLYWYIAEKEIEAIMEKYRVLLGIAPEDYKLEEIDELATCSIDNVITINPKIVAYSKEIINYIVLQQFCHLKYKTNCKAFYNMLSKYLPNYTMYEKELKTSRF